MTANAVASAQGPMAQRIFSAPKQMPSQKQTLTSSTMNRCPRPGADAYPVHNVKIFDVVEMRSKRSLLRARFLQCAISE